MARKSTALVRSPVIVALPSPGGGLARRRSRTVARVGGRGRAHHPRRKGGSGAGRHSMPLMPLVIGAGAVGWVGAKGYLAKLPEIAGSKMNTLGIAGYALYKFTKNKYSRAAGLGAMAVAAFNFGRLQGGGGIAGAGDEMLGDDVDGDVNGEDNPGGGGGY